MKKIILSAVMMLSVVGLSDDDAPHWIGLDTTLRNADQVVSVPQVVSTGVDTRVSEIVYSAGTSVRGYKRPGLQIIIR